MLASQLCASLRSETARIRICPPLFAALAQISAFELFVNAISLVRTRSVGAMNE